MLNIFHSQHLINSGNQIFSLVKQNYDKYDNHIIIVKDNFAWQAENFLLDELNTGCSFKAQVYTLNRYISHLKLKLNYKKKSLTKLDSILIIKSILIKNKNLKYFTDIKNKKSLASKLYDTIALFKSNGIGPLDVINIKSDNSEKINDIKIIYEEYLEKTKIFDDAQDGIKTLIDLLNKTENINTTAFYFAYFDNFTFDDYELISCLLNKKADLYVGIRKSEYVLNSHLFSDNMFVNLNKIALNQNVKVASYHVFDKNNGLKLFLAKNLFAFGSTQSYDIEKGEIEVVSCKSEDEELEEVCKNIRYKVLYENCRYRDFAVCESDCHNKANKIKEIFLKYDIPFYLEQECYLSEFSLPKFIVSLLKIKTNEHIDAYDISNLISNEYCELNELIKDKFIHAIKLFNFVTLEEFFNILNVEDILPIQEWIKEKITQFNNYEPPQDFAEKIKNIINYNHEKTCNILQLIENETYKKRFEQVEKKLITVCEEISDYLDNYQFELSELLKVLEECFEFISIKSIPLVIDSVFIGQEGQSIFSNVKHLFMCGINAGKSPKHIKDLGIISDNELSSLSCRYILDSKTSDINNLSKLKTYDTCLGYSQSLHLSFVNGNGQSISHWLKHIINGIKIDGKPFQITFVDDKIISNRLSDESFNKYLKYSLTSQKAIDEKLSASIRLNEDGYGEIYEYFVNILSKSNNFSKYFNLNNYINLYKIADINNYFSNRSISVSKLEKFFACPFKHYIENILLINMPNKEEFGYLKNGNFYHSVAEEFFKRFDKKLLESKNLEQELIDDIIMCAVKQNKLTDLYYSKDNKNKIQIAFVIANRLIRNLFNQSKQTHYLPLNNYNEHLIKNGAFEICDNIYLSGRIDRVDFFDGKFRVVDYKSSTNYSLEKKKMYMGKTLQLPMYVNYIKKETNLQPISMSYYYITDGYKKADANKNFSYNGIYVGEVEELNNLDFKLIKDGYSSMLGIKYDKDKQTLQKSNKLVNPSEFNKLCENAFNLSKSAVKNIQNGLIDASPLENECDYCEYKSICKFDLWLNNKTRKYIQTQNTDGEEC